MTQVAGLAVLFVVAGVLLVALLTGVVVQEARRPRRRTAAYAVAHGLACDPGDRGLVFESWVLDRPNGVRLPVWEVAGEVPVEAPPSDGDQNREEPRTVVFVHGWGQSRIDMLAHMDPWDRLAPRLVLYDLRGHGDADDGPSTLGAGDADDLLALLERLGTGRAVLVGHSMGAMIAVHAAARAPNSVAGVVAYGLYDDFHAALRRRLRASGFPARPVTDIAMAWFRLNGLRHRPLRDVMARVRCPLLVVQGGADPIAPLAGAEDLVRSAPDATLHHVEGAAHLDAPFVDAAAHAALIRTFVERVAPVVTAAERTPPPAPSASQ